MKKTFLNKCTASLLFAALLLPMLSPVPLKAGEPAPSASVISAQDDTANDLAFQLPGPVENGEGLTDIILTGTPRGGGSDVEMPVYRIRQGTSDGKHFSIFFAGDGYTETEQDQFILDVREKTKLLLETFPINQFEDRFDAYAVLVPSENSGKYQSGKETFFRCQTPNSANKQHLFQNIRNPLAARLGINKDNDVYSTIVVTNYAFGQGVSGNYWSSVGKGAHAVFVHETGHAAHNLADEYFANGLLNGGSKTRSNRIYITDIAKDGLSAGELNALTIYDYDKLDVTKVRWSEYLGYRNVYVDSFDDNGAAGSSTELRPSHKQCMMGAAGEPFCPVCEAEIFGQLNRHFGTPCNVFVPQPVFSYALMETPLYYCNQQNNNKFVKPGITYLPSGQLGKPEKEFQEFTTLSAFDPVTGKNEALSLAGTHDLTFRTVVLPFEAGTNLTLRVTALDTDHTVFGTWEKEFSLNRYFTGDYAALGATSLALTVPEEELSAGAAAENIDLKQALLVGEIIDTDTGVVLKSTDTPE